MTSDDPRIAAAERVLAGHGVAADVSIEGHEREIAAVRVAANAWERMLGDDGAAMAAEVKALGFRYVALDLAPAPGDESDAR